jgi:TolC family type I secretion outer membrane protein
MTAAPAATPMATPASGSARPTVAPSAVPTTLSLNQAEDIALADSPSLEIQRSIVDQTNATIGINRSGELPDLTGHATYARSKSNVTGVTSGTTKTAPTPGSSEPVVFTQNNAFLQLTQLILDGGRVNAEVQAARYSTNSQKLTLLRTVQTVLLTVAQNYYAALQARHQYEAAQKSLDVAKVQEKLVEAQFHAGVASHADVLTAQLPVAQAEVTLASAQNGEAQNIAALLATMGLPANMPIMLQDDTSVSPSQTNMQEAFNSALAERFDLAAAKESLNEAQATVRATKLQSFPLINATGSYGTASTSAPGGNYAGNWSIGAQLSFPLYSGGLIKSETDQARAVEEQATASYKSTELTVYENVQQAYLQLLTAQSSLYAAKVALDQAQVVLNVTNAQYKAGVTTLPLLLNAQSGLTTAQSSYVQALYAYKVAQQNLLYAEGTLAPQS